MRFAPKSWLLRLSYFLPALAFIPLLGAPARADQEYHPLLFGFTLNNNPGTLFQYMAGTWTQAIGGFGNYRPLGRMVEELLDWLMFNLMAWFHLPLSIVLILVTAIVACFLTWSVVALYSAVARLTGMPSERVNVWKIPLILLMTTTFVASGRSSLPMLFGGLYYFSAALVILAPVFIFKIWSIKGFTFFKVTALLGIGAAFAIFNELTYLGPVVVFGVAAVVAIHQHGWRIKLWLSTSHMRAALAVLAGFIPVFVPIRLVLSNVCKHIQCYDNSSLSFNLGTIVTWFRRSIAWFAPLQQSAALRMANSSLRTWGVVLLVAFIATLLVLWLTRLARSWPTEPSDAPKSVGISLLVVGMGVLLTSALLVAPSHGLQTRSGSLGAGWRESGLTTAGGSLALLAVLMHFTARLKPTREKIWRAVSLALILTVLGGSLYANQVANKFLNEDPRAVLLTKMQNQLVHFGQDAASESARCINLEALYPIDQAPHKGRISAFQNASQMINGKPFCSTLKTK